MPNDFHTHRDATSTQAGATQPFFWKQGIWRHKSGGGPFCAGLGGRKCGGDTSHICHQNHRLSEGAGEVMNEPLSGRHCYDSLNEMKIKKSVMLDIFCLFKERSVLSVVCITMILRLSALTSLPLEDVFPPFSRTLPRFNASVLAHLQPKTYPSPFHILTAPPPRDRVSSWTQGRSLTEPWMLFGRHTFPKRLAAAPIVAEWEQKECSSADPSGLLLLPCPRMASC